jgi:hypothetical protein
MTKNQWLAGAAWFITPPGTARPMMILNSFGFLAIWETFETAGDHCLP